MHTKLAKNSAEHYLKHQELMPVPPYLPGNLSAQHACYVSIFENPGRHFRSTFGTVLPRQSSLAKEIIANTVQAVLNKEGRAIRQVDLQYLVYTIAVLGPLERVGGDNHLDPKRYGLYIRSDRDKKAVVLTDRAGIETGEDQIATAIREATINTKEESYTLYRFSITHYD